MTSLVAPTVIVHPTCNSWYNGGNVRERNGCTWATQPESRSTGGDVTRCRRRIHRVRLRLADEDVRAGLPIGRDFAGVLPRAQAGPESRGWNPLSQSAVRLLGRGRDGRAGTVWYDADGAAAEAGALGGSVRGRGRRIVGARVAGAHADPEPLQCKVDSSAAVRTSGL